MQRGEIIGDQTIQVFIPSHNSLMQSTLQLPHMAIYSCDLDPRERGHLMVFGDRQPTVVRDFHLACMLAWQLARTGVHCIIPAISASHKYCNSTSATPTPVTSDFGWTWSILLWHRLRQPLNTVIWALEAYRSIWVYVFLFAVAENWENKEQW